MFTDVRGKVKWRCAPKIDGSVMLCLVTLVVLCLTQTVLTLATPTSSDDTSDLINRVRNYWECWEKSNHLDVSSSGKIFCPIIFDKWICVEPTEAGKEAIIKCPNADASDNARYARKNCLENGTWDHSQDDISLTCHLKDTYDDVINRVMNNAHDLPKSPYNSHDHQMLYENCVKNVLAKPPVYKDRLFCPGTFDGWSCWNDTLAGDTAYNLCPTFIMGFQPTRLAHKICNEDGTWYRHPDTNKSWSNYTTCIDREDLEFREKIIHIYLIGYSISVTTLAVSLMVFFAFRTLKCGRITIHKNLFLSFITNNVMWIVWHSLVVNPELIEKYEVPCKVLHVFLHYFLVCNYFWMFCEGLYLHTLLVVAFLSEHKIMKWLYVIGWGIPMVLVIIYASVRSSIPSINADCWIEEDSTQYIISGPICFSLLLNLGFLINIVRVLVTKLRTVNSPDSHYTRKAVRATLILIPLLGLHYIIIPFRPETDSPQERLYTTVTAVVTSFQGFCVALLFCFFNGEVIALVRKKWKQEILMRQKDRRTSYAATTISACSLCSGTCRIRACNIRVHNSRWKNAAQAIGCSQETHV